jgi:hypothetical protein
LDGENLCGEMTLKTASNFCGKLLANRGFELTGMPGNMEGIPGFSRNNMVVQMKHRLHGLLAVVKQDMASRGIDGCGYRPGQYRQLTTDLGQEIGRHIKHIAVMSLRNDQGMAMDDRADIQKAQEILVFKNFETGNLAGGNFAEDATGVMRVLWGGMGHKALRSINSRKDIFEIIRQQELICLMQNAEKTAMVSGGLMI